MHACRQILICGLFGSLFIALACFVSQSPTQNALAQQTEPSQVGKWQHAQLLIVTGSRNNSASLSTPTQEIIKVNLVDVFKEASGKENIDPNKFRNVDMLNYLGSQGWQVATHAVIQIEDQRVARVYTFKKPRP
jgi:hypothetical protein